MTDLGVKRELKLITNPSRYTSKASEAFKKRYITSIFQFLKLNKFKIERLLY